MKSHDVDYALLRRRDLLCIAGAGISQVAFSQPGAAQPAQNKPAPANPQPRFSYDDVIKRARDLGSQNYEGKDPVLPEPLNNLSYDAYADIHFREDRTFLVNGGGPFKMQLFPLGYLFKRSVTINIVQDGLARPIPYTAGIFDYGKLKFDKPLPVDTGFAGFRLYYPLNSIKAHDESISFLGASYFRFISRGQIYGLSARGLAINSGVDGEAEEFPYFQEFWIGMPAPGADHVTIHALLDSPSVSGAYQFLFSLGAQSSVEVTATLFPRKDISRIGIAPLTSMFFYGENDRRINGDYRPKLHDSDGLQIETGTGEWLWRPLRNPSHVQVSDFLDSNMRGFGLIQRDTRFDHYQDLDLKYERRPSFWIEPMEGWGEGQVELVELPTSDETNDNIVTFWRPKTKTEAHQSQVFRYRISSLANPLSINPNGYVVNTFQAPTRALGSTEPVVNNSTRFLIDFIGGDLGYHLAFPEYVQAVASVSQGRMLRSYVLPNPQINGFRAAVDVAVDQGQVANIRVFLKSGSKTLTETWTTSWQADQ